MGNAGKSGIQRHTSKRMKKKKTGSRAKFHFPCKAVRKERVFVSARHSGLRLVTFAWVFLGGRGSRPPLAPLVCVVLPHGGRDSAVPPANLWSLRRHLWLVRDPCDPSGRLLPPRRLNFATSHRLDADSVRVRYGRDAIPPSRASGGLAVLDARSCATGDARNFLLPGGAGVCCRDIFGDGALDFRTRCVALPLSAAPREEVALDVVKGDPTPREEVRLPGSRTRPRGSRETWGGNIEPSFQLRPSLPGRH